MDSTVVEVILANRSFLYALAARGFAEEPDCAFLDMIASEQARQQVCLLDDELTEALASQLESCAELACTDGALVDVRHEYVRMFIGPGAPEVAPYETVFLTGKPMLFQPGALEVREAYRAAGFEPAECRSVPDDFVGIEFDFMAKLACEASRAWSMGDVAKAQGYLAESLGFLDGHVLGWVPEFAERLAEAHGDCFYTWFSLFAAQVAQRDRRAISQLIEAL